MDVGVPVRVHSRAGDDLGIAHVPVPVELGDVPYAERGSPKFEKAALRWLERYLTESSPRLQRFAEITTSLAKRELEAGGLN